MEINKKVKVASCHNSCPFFVISSEGMQCNHPFFDIFSDPYEKMIITQDNSHNGNIPEKCPLRKEKLATHYEYELDNIKS